MKQLNSLSSILPKIRKELIYCEHKSLQISRFAKLASFTVAGAMPQSANLLIFCASHSHNDTSLRNLGITEKVVGKTSYADCLHIALATIDRADFISQLEF